MMDIQTTVKTATKTLAPALPYLMKAGGKIAEETLKNQLGPGWEIAKKLWTLLKPAVDAKPAATEAAQDVAGAPDDEDRQAALRVQFKKIFESNEALAAEIHQLLESAEKATSYQAELHGSGAIAQGPGAVAAGKGGVAVGGDVQGGVTVTDVSLTKI
jgi:hypothetical protein